MGSDILANMKIIVMSDTHGNYPLALRACEMAGPVDAIIHLGDGAEDVQLLKQVLPEPVISIAGNCDTGSNAPRELLWESGNKHVLLVHGDRYGVKNSLARLEQRGLQLKADAVLFGHSHHALIENLSGMLFINPGTLMKSDTPTSFAILEIASDAIKAQLMTIA